MVQDINGEEEKEMIMEVVAVKRYRPRLAKKKKGMLRKCVIRRPCFLSEYIIDNLWGQLVDVFKGFKYAVFRLSKDYPPDKLQLHGYQKLLSFQRVGCCYSFLLTHGGCQLCDDPTVLEDGGDNSDKKLRRCSRFDTSKNRSRDWRLLGISVKNDNRTFIIMWKRSKKYDKKIKELLDGTG